MKIHKALVGVAITALMTTSCQKVLDFKPTDQILKEDAIKTAQDLRNLLNSTYSQHLGTENLYGNRLNIFSEMLADNFNGSHLGGNYGEVYNRNSSVFNTDVSNLYSSAYTVIYRANVALENIAVASGEERNALEGEAYLLRALMHFEMVRLFAQPYGYTADNSHLGVPVRTESRPSAAVRATVGQVYEAVIADLKAAEGLLPATAPVGLPSRWAAKGFLARVYFQMNDFQNAYNYANDVISNGPVQFNPAETELTTRISLAGSSESLFTLVSDAQNNRVSGLIGSYRSDVNSAPVMRVASTWSGTATADATDRRTTWYRNSANGYLVTKYDFSTFVNLPLLHLTELKLIRAESAGELGQDLSVAIADLNDIMARAYQPDKSLGAGSTPALIIATARDERRKELFAEGNRLHEIRRLSVLGENSTIRNSPWDCPGLVLQFPQGETANSPNFPSNPEGGC